LRFSVFCGILWDVRITKGIRGKTRALESLGARVFVSREGRNWHVTIFVNCGLEKPPFSVTAVFYSLAQLEAFLDAFQLGFNLGRKNNGEGGEKNV
jgi:hypothetical protein